MTDLSMYRGDDRSLTITATEDLTGSEIRWTAKQSRGGDPVIEKDAVIGTPSTSATVTIDAADTGDLLPTTLYWDVEITDALGRIRTVATGHLQLLPDVTRPAV